MAARPLNEARITYWLKVVGLVVLGWLIVEKLSGYLTAVGYAVAVGVGGLFLAYLFYPMVHKLNERLPLWLAMLVVYVLFGFFVLVALSYVVPPAIADVQSLSKALPKLENDTRNALMGPHVPVISTLPAAMREYLLRLPSEIGNFITTITAASLGNFLSVVLSVLSLGAIFVAMPVVSVYMLYEAEPIKRQFLGMLPASRRDRAKNILAELDAVLGGYVRGQLAIALIVGILVWLMLALFHVPYALLIGVWAGIFDVVPYLGALAGAIPGIFLAAVTNGAVDAVLVTAGFAAIYQIEGSLIAPHIVSRTVRISPLAAIFALLVGGELFGIVGVLVAVPVAGAIRVLIDNVRPPDEMTNVDVDPGLTKAAHFDVHPLSTGTDVTTAEVEHAVAKMREEA
jgi:predicted PurR-regulated permease PerM